MNSVLCGLRVGNGYDVHVLREGLPMRLCGVDIPSAKGFVAHSDGDVAIHALCDAILGAAALGDIGLHFPDSDPRFKGIDSRELLAHVVELVSGEGAPSASLRFAPCPGKWSAVVTPSTPEGNTFKRFPTSEIAQCTMFIKLPNFAVFYN